MAVPDRSCRGHGAFGHLVPHFTLFEGGRAVSPRFRTGPAGGSSICGGDLGGAGRWNDAAGKEGRQQRFLSKVLLRLGAAILAAGWGPRD